MEGDPLKEHSYNHIAFELNADEFDQKLRCIHALGLTVKEDRSRVSGEGRSLFFYDYDNHLFELHSGNLEDRLRRYTGS